MTPEVGCAIWIAVAAIVGGVWLLAGIGWAVLTFGLVLALMCIASVMSGIAG